MYLRVCHEKKRRIDDIRRFFLRPENNDGEKHIEFLRASAMQPADAHFRIL